MQNNLFRRIVILFYSIYASWAYGLPPRPKPYIRLGWAIPTHMIGLTRNHCPPKQNQVSYHSHFPLHVDDDESKRRVKKSLLKTLQIASSRALEVWSGIKYQNSTFLTTAHMLALWSTYLHLLVALKWKVWVFCFGFVLWFANASPPN